MARASRQETAMLMGALPSALSLLSWQRETYDARAALSEALAGQAMLREALEQVRAEWVADCTCERRGEDAHSRECPCRVAGDKAYDAVKLALTATAPVVADFLDARDAKVRREERERAVALIECRADAAQLVALVAAIRGVGGGAGEAGGP